MTDWDLLQKLKFYALAKQWDRCWTLFTGSMSGCNRTFESIFVASFLFLQKELSNNIVANDSSSERVEIFFWNWFWVDLSVLQHMYWRGCVKISSRVPWFSCLLKDLCCECFAQKSNIPKSLFVGKTQKMQRIFLYKNLPWKCKFPYNTTAPIHVLKNT